MCGPEDPSPVRVCSQGRHVDARVRPQGRHVDARVHSQGRHIDTVSKVSVCGPPATSRQTSSHPTTGRAIV